MFSLVSLPVLSFPLRLSGVGSDVVVDVRPVEVHDVDISHDKRARTLKHLLKLNHANHSIVYHRLQFHNHMPHVCGFPNHPVLRRLMVKTRY